MKKVITFLSALIISLSTFSQISTNENPPSFKENINKDNIPIITMPALNYEIINEEDSIDNLNGLPPRFGFDFDVDINMENSGRWMDLPNKKGKIYQLEIYCPGALSINPPLPRESFRVVFKFSRLKTVPSKTNKSLKNHCLPRNLFITLTIYNT